MPRKASRKTTPPEPPDPPVVLEETPTSVVPDSSQALALIQPGTGQMALTLDEAKKQTDEWLAMREYILHAIESILVEKVDYYIIKDKKSLGKPGAEKLAALPMFRFTSQFRWDDATLSCLDDANGWVAYWCDIYDASGRIVAQGGGARHMSQDDGDLNKCRKMCQKSAFIDGVIRACGISDVITQDLEDMGLQDDKPKGRQAGRPVNRSSRTARAAPAPPTPAEPPPPAEQPVDQPRDDDKKPNCPCKGERFIPPHAELSFLESLLESDRIDDQMADKIMAWVYNARHCEHYTEAQVQKRFVKAITWAMAAWDNEPLPADVPPSLGSAALASLDVQL